MHRLVFLLLLLFATSAGARMYQWQDPVTKSVQFSGIPPAWYRSPEGGPRVRVYDGGTLVDDTYIRLSPEDNATLREAAFQVLEQEKEQEAIKRLERAARREKARQEQAEREARRAQAAVEQEDTTQAPPEVLPENLDPAMVTRLKAIISAYDKSNTGGGAAGTPAPETNPATTPSKGGAGTPTY